MQAVKTSAGHITDAQIEQYVKQGSANSPEAQPGWLESHVADCESCLDRLLNAERIHLGLLEGDGMKETPYPGCPADETLQELAAGICPPEIAETSLEHAAHCDYCAPRLSLYLKEFAESVAPEDAAILEKLETSKPKWQKKFVRENLATARQETRRPFFGGLWPKVAVSFAVLAVAAGLYFVLRPADDLRQAQKLVAAAYGERRTIEMRLADVPYASYAPPTVERGPGGSTALAYQQPSLLRAGAAVGDKLKSEGKLDPKWLQVKGRVALLEATPASARDAQGTLEQAQAAGLSDPSLEIDLAASYFERAVREENPDLSPTINLLRTALSSPQISNQERLAALFDLGIAYQNSKMFDLAGKTWEQYLALDSSSDWAREARQRLEDARKAAPPPKESSSSKSEGPLFFLAHSSEPAITNQLETYQDHALRFWLAGALREPHGASSQAVYKLAALLEQQNLDSWFNEFLHSVNKDDTAAVDALSAAIRANKKGFYSSAVERSQFAANSFAKQGNKAGELRARYESVYASQRFLEGFDCLSQIASIRVPDDYRWLQIQLALERSACSNFGGDFRTIQADLEENRRKAEGSHFYVLALRAIALGAGIKRQQQAGCREVWEQTAQGLDLYWRHDGRSPERLYEFYSILEQCAAQTKLWYAAETLQRHCITLLEQENQDDDPNLILEGSAHAELAAILTAVNRDADARTEQNAADSRWNQVRNERRADTYRLFMLVRLAEIQLNRGDALLALSTLDSSRRLLGSTQYELLSIDFYRLLGATCWRLHRLAEAESAYAEGINIAENSLRSIQHNARDRLKWITKVDEVYRGMTRVWLEESRTDEAWKLWEWYRTRSLPQSPGLPGPTVLVSASWDVIEAQIAKVRLPEDMHVVYASFADGLETWTVDSKAIKAHWIQVQQSEINSLVNDFAQRCADPSSSLNELHARAQKLYALLLQPVVSDLPKSGTVVAELDRALSQLVLPALMTPEGKYFAESYKVVYSPGVLVEKNLRPPLPIEADDRLLLLDASGPGGAAGLPGHLKERDAALRSYSHVRVVSGDETSAAELKRQLWRSTVFDFIGHGEQHGSYTELRLSPKVLLTAADFPPVPLAHIKLSILAACSTGAGGEDRLLDTGNLVHSFLSAGVPDVIASQWNVDSAATMQLMQMLHAHLGSGETAPQAMFQAQKEMLLTRNHPYFWAGFNLSGRAN